MKTLGWVATFVSVMMYHTYHKSWTICLVIKETLSTIDAAVNYGLWVYYGLFKRT